ncbi:MAG: 4-hydroxy-tetrahydrodipicolinate synthase [Firmicutes bacterium]|nr:4-hydroxy-tetrahydrodipicolinate synthase [Bacillota bacterium]
MPIFTGSGVAIVTPFNDKGVDYGAFGKLIDYQIKNGTDAIVACGTTGESATMTPKEHEEVITFAVKYVNKRIPVICGAGSNSTAEAISYSKHADRLGADAILSITPYYNKCSQKGLIAHYTAIADAVKCPLVIYNVPSRTGVNITPYAAGELAKHTRIAAIKEASGNIDQITETAIAIKGKMDLYSGDDGTLVPLMSVGGIGVISASANVIPRQMHDIAMLCLKGDYIAANNLQQEVYPLVKALFSDVNPIPVKTACNLMGLNAGKLRLPLTEMDTSAKEKLISELKKLKLIK